MPPDVVAPSLSYQTGTAEDVEAQDVLAELSDWVTDLLAGVCANPASMRSVLLASATFGARAELQAHDLLYDPGNAPPSLTNLGQRVAAAAAHHRRRHGPSSDWVDSVAEADAWLDESP
jgi:hypothetical protein